MLRQPLLRLLTLLESRHCIILNLAALAFHRFDAGLQRLQLLGIVHLAAHQSALAGFDALSQLLTVQLSIELMGVQALHCRTRGFNGGARRPQFIGLAEIAPDLRHAAPHLLHVGVDLLQFVEPGNVHSELPS